MKRILLLVVVGVLALPSSAAYRKWKAYEGVYNGRIDDRNHFNEGEYPGFNDYIQFENNVSYAISFPNDACYTNEAGVFIRTYRGKEISFDFRNSGWIQPDMAEIPASIGTRFRLRYTNLAGTDNDALSFSLSDTHGAFALLDGKFRYSIADAKDEVTWDLDSGLYNFLDPNGVPTDGYITFGGSHCSLMRVRVHPDATLRTGEFRFGQSATNELLLAEGSHTLGAVKFLSAADFVRTDRIGLTDGARLSLASFAGDDAAMHAAEISLSGGSALTMRGAVTQKALSKLTVDVTDGSTFGSEAGATVSFGETAGSEAVVRVADSSVMTGGELRFGCSAADSAPTCDLYVTNSLVSVTNGATIRFGSGTARFVDSTVSFGNLYSGAGDIDLLFANSTVSGGNVGFGTDAGTDVRATLSGGTLTATSQCYVGHKTGARAELVLTNGAELVSVGWISIAAAGTGTLHVAGGKIRAEDRIAIDGNLDLNAYGRFILSDGEVTMKNALYQPRRNGDMLIEGGTLTAANVAIGSLDGAGYESTFRQTGGTVNLTSSSESVGFNVADNANSGPVRLILEGGVMSCHRVRGWSGAKAKGGKGFAAFEADGGTLTTHKDSAALIETFDEAVLGDRGLTVDNAGYDVTIKQVFAPKEGSSGRLVLKGSGTMTIDAAGSTYRWIDVAGGTLAFSAAADCCQFVTVTNGGAVAFGGKAAGAGTVRGLVVDNGRIILAKGETVSVDGPIVLSDVTLGVTGSFDIGDTVTLVSTEPISEATANAWRAGYVAAGLAQGKSADLTVEGSALRVTIRACVTDVIRLKSGVSNAVENVLRGAGDEIRADVWEGAALTLSGDYGRGHFSKTGSGAAYLAGDDNLFLSGVSAGGGLLSVASAGALGLSADSESSVLTQTAGTVEFAAGDGSPIVLTRAMAISPAAQPDAVIIKTERPVVMPSPDLKSGSIMKRGAGALTFEAGTGMSTIGLVGAGTVTLNPVPAAADAVSFDDFGTVPTGVYTSFEVYEGEMRLVGTDANAVFKVYESMGVGSASGAVSAQPGLVVDGATLDDSINSRHLIIAPNVTADNSGVTDPYLYVTNGSTLKLNTLRVGASATQPGLKTHALFDNSTLYCDYRLSPNCCTGEGSEGVFVFRNGSSCEVGSGNIYLIRKSTLVFDNSILQNKTGGAMKFQPDADAAFADVTFRNGSVCRCDGLAGARGGVSLVFDGAEWVPSAGDFEFSFATPTRLDVGSTGAGLVLSPATDKTWTWRHVLQGDGGLVKKGAGTLVIGTNGYDTDATSFRNGTLDVREGVVKIEPGAVPAGFDLCGCGTIADSALPALTLKPGDFAETPLFSGCTFTGRVAVDCGRTAENPMAIGVPVPVARYEGSVPDLSKWRVKNTGLAGVRGIFAAKDGVVSMTVTYSGLILLLR